MDDNEAKKKIMDMLVDMQGNLNELHKGTDGILADMKEMRTNMNTRFDALDAQFDSVDTHFDRIDNKLGSIESNLDRISQLAEEEIQREKNRTAQYKELLDRLKNGTQ
ncbi:hypothetical protein [Lysinibacillus sp. Bpr_S20]|uniref:hypothetical protein n=1 Tax=Lysinibacillus sp. Bpr_S20 TaxID=2933964 RepID=UPI0020128C1D|nr:hypothetical protein [Lysinibacillus sp. Bpr_S20]MCL1701178.1 hypothetical protein [Lysinibacillus sp. Bpr_S20]